MTTIKITKFDRANVTAILDECRAALRPIAEKYGLVLDNRGRTYHADTLPVMFQFLLSSGNGATEERHAAAAAEFRRFSKMYGFKPTDLGRVVPLRGASYKIVGLKPRSRTYPILLDNVATDKTYKFAAAEVLRALEIAEQDA